MDLDAYKLRQERNFAILDALPRSIRALVHEHGAKKVVTLWQRGLNADAIADHFEEEAVFNDCF